MRKKYLPTILFLIRPHTLGRVAQSLLSAVAVEIQTSLCNCILKVMKHMYMYVEWTPNTYMSCFSIAHFSQHCHDYFYEIPIWGGLFLLFLLVLLFGKGIHFILDHEYSCYLKADLIPYHLHKCHVILFFQIWEQSIWKIQTQKHTLIVCFHKLYPSLADNKIISQPLKHMESVVQQKYHEGCF